MKPSLRSVAFLALLAACSSKQTSTGTTIYTCNADADCTSIGFVCDKQRLECVCTSDKMCTSNHAAPYCNVFTGTCVATHTGCTDTSCPSGQYCDESIRQCAPLTPYCGSCTSNAECGPNNECVVHPDFPGTPAFCAAPCGANKSCPMGQTCKTVAAGGEQCVPTGQLCTGGNQNCTPDALTPCQSDTDCMGTSGQICSKTLNVCVAATTTCAPGQACDPRTMTCVLACQTNQDCVSRFGQGFECLGRTCVPQGECKTDSDCPSSQFCLVPPGTTGAGECTATCQTDSDCPTGTLCKMGSSGRNSCVAGCKLDTDCLLTQICNSSGVCETGHCQDTTVCPFDYVCQNSTCVKAQGQCSTCDNGCQNGGVCAALYFCCNPANCPSMPGVKCGAVAGQCASGQNLCMMNRCLNPCMTQADCPQGFTCETSDINGSAQTLCQTINDGAACLNPP